MATTGPLTVTAAASATPAPPRLAWAWPPPLAAACVTTAAPARATAALGTIRRSSSSNDGAKSRFRRSVVVSHFWFIGGVHDNSAIRARSAISSPSCAIFCDSDAMTCPRPAAATAAVVNPVSWSLVAPKRRRIPAHQCCRRSVRILHAATLRTGWRLAQSPGPGQKQIGMSL